MIFVRTDSGELISMDNIKSIKKKESNTFGNYVELINYQNITYKTKEVSKTMLSAIQMLKRWSIETL